MQATSRHDPAATAYTVSVSPSCSTAVAVAPQIGHSGTARVCNMAVACRAPATAGYSPRVAGVRGEGASPAEEPPAEEPSALDRADAGRRAIRGGVVRLGGYGAT